MLDKLVIYCPICQLPFVKQRDLAPNYECENCGTNFYLANIGGEYARKKETLVD